MAAAMTGQTPQGLARGPALLLAGRRISIRGYQHTRDDPDVANQEKQNNDRQYTEDETLHASLPYGLLRFCLPFDAFQLPLLWPDGTLLDAAACQVAVFFPYQLIYTVSISALEGYQSGSLLNRSRSLRLHSLRTKSVKGVPISAPFFRPRVNVWT